jgi:polyferredoxin|tara:strand:- start:1008 stop:1301 length:294 start_codon:yes stop_codon:yes gene_type:complete
MRIRKLLDALFFIGDEQENASGPSWKYRRKLIYGGYRLGFAMVIFGALTFLVDQWSVGTTLITGGVSLITIILTAYTATATFEDVKLRHSSTEQKEP